LDLDTFQPSAKTARMDFVTALVFAFVNKNTWGLFAMALDNVGLRFNNNRPIFS